MELVASPLRMQVVAWMPQNDILAHPHLRAFLSHVGLNSMYEVYHEQGAWPATDHQLAAENALRLFNGVHKTAQDRRLLQSHAQ